GRRRISTRLRVNQTLPTTNDERPTTRSARQPQRALRDEVAHDLRRAGRDRHRAAVEIALLPIGRIELARITVELRERALQVERELFDALLDLAAEELLQCRLGRDDGRVLEQREDAQRLCGEHGRFDPGLRDAWAQALELRSVGVA